MSQCQIQYQCRIRPRTVNKFSLLLSRAARLYFILHLSPVYKGPRHDWQGCGDAWLTLSREMEEDTFKRLQWSISLTHLTFHQQINHLLISYKQHIMDLCDSMLKYPDNTSTHVIRDNWGQAITEVMAEDICMQWSCCHGSVSLHPGKSHMPWLKAVSQGMPHTTSTSVRHLSSAPRPFPKIPLRPRFTSTYQDTFRNLSLSPRACIRSPQS